MKMHSFEDIPVDEIDSGKFGTPLAWEAEPGDAIAFHGRTIHGAPGNNCQNRHRRVLSLRWLGEVGLIFLQMSGNMTKKITDYSKILFKSKL